MRHAITRNIPHLAQQSRFLIGCERKQKKRVLSYWTHSAPRLSIGTTALSTCRIES